MKNAVKKTQYGDASYCTQLLTQFQKSQLLHSVFQKICCLVTKKNYFHKLENIPAQNEIFENQIALLFFSLCIRLDRNNY